MRVLITGAAGFVGSHLCDRFLAEGHQVVGMDNFLTGSPRNIQHLMGRDDFEFIEHDITHYIEVDGQLDGVLNFASPASPIDYLNLPIETLTVGAYGTHNTLGLARAKGARYLMASTSEVYGDPEVHPQPESYPGNVSSTGPRSVYDEAKRFAEAMVMAYHRTYQLDTRIVRIFNTYGPRMRHDDGRVVPNFAIQAINSQPLTLYGDGLQTRSFCYVDDLIEGLYRLFMSDEVYPVNLGTTFEMTMVELADLINDITGNQAGTVIEDKRIKDDPQQRKPDLTRAKTILGWEPAVDVHTGMTRTLAYFRERLAQDA